MVEQLKVERAFEDKVDLMARRIAAVSDCEKKHEEVAERHQVKLRSLKLSAGAAMLEVRAAVEAGEIGDQATWWEWFEDHIRVPSRKTAEHWMMLAGAPEPEAKVIEFRAKDAARKKAAYQPKVPIASENGKSPREADLVATAPRMPAAPKRYPASPDDDRLIAEITALFRKLSWSGIARLYKEITDLYHLWQSEGRQ